MQRIFSATRRIGAGTGAALLFFGICAFNSQEHKIVADVGVSRVSIPASVIFPDGVSIQRDFNYLVPWQNAKMLAVGFKTNNLNDFSDTREGVQDNCYRKQYGQKDFNMKNYIENDRTLWPTTLLNIDAYAGSVKESFSFGDLVAIYGDYRRTVYADDNGDCYLTNDRTDEVVFNGKSNARYCPRSMTVGDYLHSIAFGVCPPYGVGGNYIANTAADDQYSEVGWWGDEMLRVANVNETHFSNVAVAWYIGMHRLALNAVEHATREPRYWKMALHYEAYALHSLTDLFSFGHAVTNRDETSYGAIGKKGLRNEPAYKWMEGVVGMGGGKRNENGTLELTSDFRPYSYQMATRKDFMPSYLATWAWRGYDEHEYHDQFNRTGARVRNFNGDAFQVYGDYKLHDLDAASRRVIENSVTASVQSLFNYYDQLKAGATEAELNRTGNNSKLFDALKYIPVFIEKDEANYFFGMWTSYAGPVGRVLGREDRGASWERCRIPSVSGANYRWPARRPSPCTAFN